MDASHVYVGAWALGCFHSHISTRTFRRALTASVDMHLRGDKECPFSGVTKSGRVWSKVPESDARSVGCNRTPNLAFRRPSPNSARFSYAIEGVLFISAQLSSDAVSALRKVRVLI